MTNIAFIYIKHITEKTDSKVGDEEEDTFRVPTLSLKWNSLTFHWLFPDQNSFFPDHFTALSHPPRLLTAVCYFNNTDINQTKSLKCMSFTSEICIQIKKTNRQTTGSSHVRKEHYKTLCCVWWFVNMLYMYCLPMCWPSWFQRIVPVFLKIWVYGS